MCVNATGSRSTRFEILLVKIAIAITVNCEPYSWHRRKK